MISNFTVPVLETDRLILRALSADNLEAECAFFASDASHFVGGPREPADVWGDLAKLIGHWVLRGYGFFAVEEKETGAYCGRVGPYFPEGWPEPEIGWTLMTHATGKGYATEAGKAARDYAYTKLGWKTAISLIAPGNEPSKAVAKRLGARFECDFTHYSYGRMQIWRHPGPDSTLVGAVS